MNFGKKVNKENKTIIRKNNFAPVNIPPMARPSAEKWNTFGFKSFLYLKDRVKVSAQKRARTCGLPKVDVALKKGAYSINDFPPAHSI